MIVIINALVLPYNNQKPKTFFSNTKATIPAAVTLAKSARRLLRIISVVFRFSKLLRGNLRRELKPTNKGVLA
jgi:hypothetical protein